MCLATKVVKHASHFHSDIACSDKSHFLWPLFQIEETIRAYAQLAPWSLGIVWVAACGQENLFSADFLFGAVVKNNLSFILRKEVSAAVQPFNMIVLEVLIIYAI